MENFQQEVHFLHLQATFPRKAHFPPSSTILLLSTPYVFQHTFYKLLQCQIFGDLLIMII